MVKLKSLFASVVFIGVVFGLLGPVASRLERNGEDPFNDAFLAQVKRHAKTWTADSTFRNQKLFENFRDVKGIFDSKIGFSLPTKTFNMAYDAEIPEHFDAREQWPFCNSITTIKNQGLCGGCWAVAAVSVMSDRLCIHSEGKIDVELAAEDLMGCCKDCGNGCNGGFLDGTAFQYWVDVGLVTGAAYNGTGGCKPYPFKPCVYPYEGCHPERSPPCTHRCVEGYDRTYSKDKYYGTSAYKVPNNERVIQLEIMTNGPVESGFSVFQDMYLYRSGVYHHVAGREVGKHAVRLIGWGNERGVPYWLIANSYGTDWGENGYFKMLRGSNHLGIESVVVTGLPKV